MTAAQKILTRSRKGIPTQRREDAKDDLRNPVRFRAAAS
jgi:hypothetical protein